MIPVDEHLSRLAETEPHRAALHIPRARAKINAQTRYQTLTFSQLNEVVNRFAVGLQQHFQQGDRVALLVPPREEFFALTFAFLRTGVVPVLIDPGMGLSNLGRCLAEAEVAGFVGMAKAQLARRLFGWCRSARVTVNVGARAWFCTTSTQAWRKLAPNPKPVARSRNDLAAILFTSGSTGIAKGVPYTQGIFAEQVTMLKALYQIEPGEVDWCSFPLFALFGPALGMTCVVPDLNAARPAAMNPAKARQQFRQFQVTNLFGSPAVLRKLARQTDADSYRTVRRVISAGAPARPDVLGQMQAQLPPNVPIFTPYGATESLPVANVSSDYLLAEAKTRTEQGAGVCLGYPAPGVTLKVIQIQDEPISHWHDGLLVEPGQIGEFVVSSPVTTTSYFRRDEQTALAKIYGEANPDGTTTLWHRMGDVGYQTADGRLWFCGRKSQRVVTTNGTLFTDCIEPRFNCLAGVERSALVGVGPKGQQTPVILIELQPGIRWHSLLTHLYDLAYSLGIRHVLRHPGFPVDVRHNSKIFREKLAVWAAKRVRP